jgi:hypothetical protein
MKMHILRRDLRGGTHTMTIRRRVAIYGTRTVDESWTSVRRSRLTLMLTTSED